MKPVSTIFFALIVVVSAHAQIGKGTDVLSGSIYYSTSNGESPQTSSESEYSSLSAVPRYGHFFGEKTEAGISIGYNWNHNDSKYTGNFSSSSESSSGLFLVGPYVRLYQNLAEHFYFNFSFAATFYTGGSEQTQVSFSNSNKEEYDVFQYEIGLSPGLTYFFNNHWAANFSLGILSYKHTKNTNNSNDEINTSETVNAGVNSGGLGIGFYF